MINNRESITSIHLIFLEYSICLGFQKISLDMIRHIYSENKNTLLELHFLGGTWYPTNTSNFE